MSTISDDKAEHAWELFAAGASIRQVAKTVGIARETAHRISKFIHLADVITLGKTRVFLGRRKDGSLSYYETSEVQPQWRKQHYGDELDFE